MFYNLLAYDKNPSSQIGEVYLINRILLLSVPQLQVTHTKNLIHLGLGQKVVDI